MLASIPERDYALFERDLRATTFKQGAVVQEAGEFIDRVYFPQTGMISLLVITRDGGGIEAATIGYEGAVGLHRGLGKRRSFNRGVIQLPGTISYIPAEAFEDVVRQRNSIRDLITRYTELLWAEAQQVAACNAVHDAEARLARWLLQTQDRLPSKPTSLALTQEFVAQMLGVRRTTVTLVAGALQKAGLIRYSRGKITILDQKGLEAAACECHDIIRHEKLPEVIGVDLKPR